MSGLEISREGPVAVLRLDNAPKLNALTVPMLEGLGELADSLEADRTVRAVVLTGTGPKAFCAGADITAWAEMTPAEFARDWVRRGHRIFDRLARMGKPVIAALNGHALGGGLELAAVADIRVAAPHATLGLPEGMVGIVPGWSGTQRLLRLLPEPVVKEMALFGRRIGAERALALGFVAEVAEDPLATAMEVAGGLSKMSPLAGETAKAMIHAAAGEDRGAAVEALGSAFAATTADRAEGVAAFREKRTPEFGGD